MRLAGTVFGLIVGCCAHGQGTIVYRSVDPIPIFSNGETVVRRDIDLDNDASADIRFQSTGFTFSVHGLNGTRVLGAGFEISPPLPIGFEISLDPSQSLEWLDPIRLGPDDFEGGRIFSSSPFSGTHGPFLETGYMAFQLNSDNTTRHGWLHLEIPFPNAIAGGRVLEWAYNTQPDASIIVAQVPEPSVLLYLAVGAIAFFGLDRTRSFTKWRK